ncbi:M3 family oligoendopeptidase [archaeon]|nr:M3 family oligoendopeptidase [archaeon]PJC45468.1 MAG: hypothetical protein CO037_01350 [Candidatus Pacearchaeota archaeon CG_4_9_14_0_2_um_filter_30_8]
MKTEWDLSELEGNFDKTRENSTKFHDLFKKKWEKDKSYLEDPKKLKEALDELESISEEFSNGGNEYFYYQLKGELNQNDSEVRRKASDIHNFSINESHKILFFSVDLSKISEKKRKEFLASPSLKKYKPFLEDFFENSKYILSEKEEKILSLKQNASYGMWVDMLKSLLSKEKRTSLDEEGGKKEFIYPELINLMRSQNKKIRISAKDAFEDILKKYEDVAEFEINAVLEEAKINDELREFTRADESRIKGDLIDLDFINSILDAVKSKFSISKEFYVLKAKLMKEKKIGYFERSAEIKKIEKNFGENESVKIVKKVFSNLDKDFLKIFEEMLDSGKIDFFPKMGKNGGAFCTHLKLNSPVYVLLNHTGKLRDVSVIAHEMGHAINATLMKKETPFYYESPKSTAEVASTFMEDFVYKEIFKELNEEKRFYLKVMKLEDDLSSILRQIALYLFELELHETFRKEGYISKEKIGELFVKHMSEYMGDAVEMQNAHLWWIYLEHIRMYFYVYSYASGLLISKAMQKKLREDNSFIGKIKVFLSTGTSKKPREIFKEMGIEINKEFFLDGLDELEKELEEIKTLGKKLGKL